eukprot:CAMPEP_0182492992 /NCGR_PEP_ID=MMETSP1321-20130603/2025_1 /TAXON_ID=91990 /ORGANISM="Bolidomonas sp., Strain RCC1657" /LENGTH=144 /DNA_ID=CAMNT_0024695643 /DNA_START=680 /DNA_END=1114 /DNA_ORIENTATION=-
MLRVSCSFLKLTLQLGHFMKFLPPAPCCAHLFMHELQNVWPQGVIIARGFRGGRKHMGQIVNARMLLMETDPVIDDEDALLSCETCDACDLTELAPGLPGMVMKLGGALLTLSTPGDPGGATSAVKERRRARGGGPGSLSRPSA